MRDADRDSKQRAELLARFNGEVIRPAVGARAVVLDDDDAIPSLTEAEVLEVADAITAARPAPVEPINQFRERAARYAGKRGESE